jgi:ectoine hydroxylase-related dioxygenase (phytanoyl-CoA dioxygenase family)
MDQKILDDYQKNGFAVIPDALSTEELIELNQFVDQDMIANSGKWSLASAGSGARSNAFVLFDRPDLDKYVRHHKIFPYIQEILCHEARFAQFDFRDVSPEDSENSGMNYHRDIAFFAESGGMIWDPNNPYISTFACIIYYLKDVHDCCPCFSMIPNSHEYRTLAEAKQKQGQDFKEVPIRGKAGTAILYNITTYHTRMPGHTSCHHGRRTLHNYHGRESQPPLTNYAMIPEELALNSNQETRNYYSKWCPKQIEYADLHFKSQVPSYYHLIPQEDKKNLTIKG